MNRLNIGVLAVSASLLLAVGVGAQATLSAILAIGIVSVYGLIRVLVERAQTGTDPVDTLACQLGAVMLAPLFGALVFIWGRVDGVSFLWSLVTWTAIILAGNCVKVAAEWQERRREDFFRMRLGLTAC